MARWREEVYLKREEMYRVLLFFRARSLAWQHLSDEADELGRLGAGAYARRWVTATVDQGMVDTDVMCSQAAVPIRPPSRRS